MKQGEVWLINLDPTVGSEIKKTRPAIIVNDNTLGKLPLKIIVPLTDWKDRYDIAPWMVKIILGKNNNLSKPSATDCFQVRSLSELRFTKKLGRITSEQLEEIKSGLAKVFSIEE
ncbi:type II toxin-antitoxin system PemK/MazF family toxin [Rufibacter sp. LB8]|uniref:type II toxin-antitoxin system PemK/MazF family toxin n=1 Tax=Rufibacter sp. LB8 TaxID=2777781 RepID=UPI00178C24F0|nr:type II toxin-antitoxin system PemK/MazF family toxin [Rufibacter sp. LB8]